MNKGLAHILMGRLLAVPFIDLFAGLVQVQEMEDNYEDGRKTTSRFPVSCDVVDNGQCTDAAGSLVPLTPDSGRRGILYFEDNGTTLVDKKSVYYNYRSNLRLVCWLNTGYIDLNTCHGLSMPVMTDIIERLTGSYFNQGNFVKVFATVANIPVADKNLFSKYTYDNNRHQFLMPPFEYFAIDFSVLWSMTANCINEITLKAPEC